MGWDWNPLHDAAQLAHNFNSIFEGKAGTPGLHLFTGGGGGGGEAKPPGPPGSSWGEPTPPKSTSPLEYIQQYLAATGAPAAASAQSVYNYLAAKDPKALADVDHLQQALNQYSAYAGWGAPGAGSGTTAATSSSIIDPLSAQMFFQSTIAPYLQQVTQQEQVTSDRLRNQPVVPGLPASYQAVVRQGEQTQANDMDLLMQATQAAAASAPQVAQLNQMLGLAQKSALQDYYRQIAAGVGGASTSAAAPPTSGF